MKRIKPTRSECDEFLRLIKDTKEREVRQYLIMAFKAFRDTHYEAAVVLAWAGVERYYNLIKAEVGEWYFEQHYQKAHNGKSPPDLSVVVLNRISEQTQFFREFTTRDADGSIVSQYEDLRKLRNLVAHGSGVHCLNSTQVIEAIMPVRSLATKTTSEQRFADVKKVLDFVKKADFPVKLDGLFNHFSSRDWFTDCKELIGAFLLGENVQTESIKNFVRCIYKRLTENERLRIWQNHAHQALHCLRDTGYKNRKPPAIFSFFERLPSREQALPIRDQFLEYYFEWLEDQIELAKEEVKFLKNDPGRTRDEHDLIANDIESLLRNIALDLPEHLKEKWNDVNNKWRPKHD
jgi:acyl carrier protein phosphodiesterase